MKKKSNRMEIIWNIVNSLLAGALVFLGSVSAGEINTKVILAAILASLIVAIVQFKRYWEMEQSEYCTPKLLTFIKI